MFGCPSYEKKAASQPAVPSIAEWRDFFSEYEHIAVIHIPKKLDLPEDRKEWSRKTNLDLLKLENAAFSLGFHKAFLLFIDKCRIYVDCPGNRIDCKDLKQSRPSHERLGVGVISTVWKPGYPIQVITDTTQEMQRYAF